MEIKAKSIGMFFPTGYFSGVIHSVFEHAVNIQLPDSALISVLSPEVGNIPQGVQLMQSPDFRALLREGDVSTCRSRKVYFSNSSMFTIDTRTAKIWDSDISNTLIDLDFPVQNTAYWYVWQKAEKVLLNTTQLPGLKYGIHVNYELRKLQISSVLEEIWHAVRDLSPDRTIEALESVIGLGVGLTPSGDDFIVGNLAGLWCSTKGKAERFELLSRIQDWVGTITSKTNDISYSFLKYAAKGHVSEPLVNLAQGIGKGVESEVLDRLAAKVLSVGATSGLDGLLGFLVGVSSWS